MKNESDLGWICWRDTITAKVHLGCLADSLANSVRMVLPLDAARKRDRLNNPSLIRVHPWLIISSKRWRFAVLPPIVFTTGFAVVVFIIIIIGFRDPGAVIILLGVADHPGQR